MGATHPLVSFDDRRKYPRLQINLPVRIRSAQGANVDARIFDISPDGLQVRCEKNAAQSIHPLDKLFDVNNKPVVIVAFTLPHHQGEKEIVVRCKICYMKLLEQCKTAQVAFGLKFTGFKDNCDRYISQYFVSEMEPAFQ